MDTPIQNISNLNILISVNLNLGTVLRIYIELPYDKISNLGFRPGLIQTSSLYSHRRKLEALNFGYTRRRVLLSVYRKQRR